MAARSDIQIDLSKDSLEQISGLSLALAAGFSEKRIDKALTAASLAAAKGMVKPVKAAAPKRTGRLSRAIWAKPVMRDKPGAYVGIRAGKDRSDKRGAYYRWIVTSGVRGVPYAIGPSRYGNKKAVVADGMPYRSVTRRRGIPGRPFVTEAVNNNIDTALRLFWNALTDIVNAGIPKKGRIKVPRAR